jgi:phosphoesterase RecJ-like protein
MMEREHYVRLSFRSRGQFSVNDFARKHFDGGGHQNAAGGNSNLSLNETIEKFEKILPLYQEQLGMTIKSINVS